jgi:small subunit ribosomal protein S1
VTEPTRTQPQTIADLKPKMRLEGVVKETQMYGAIVDIGLEHDGMVHISQLAPTRTNAVTDVVKPGDAVSVWVTQVNPEKGRIGLSMVEPPELEWRDIQEGQTYAGTVTRMEAYGVFVDIGAERPGLLHVREMSAGYVRHPSELVHMGDEIEVRILKIDRSKRRIDLSMIAADDAGEYALDEEESEESEPAKTAMEIALERAQAQTKTKPRRQKRTAESPDISDREAILARTLKQHSQG